MDIARALESLVPGARFKGTLKDNTQEQFEAIEWIDMRERPTSAEITAEDGRLAILDHQAGNGAAARRRVNMFRLRAAREVAAGDGDFEVVIEIDRQLGGLVAEAGE